MLSIETNEVAIVVTIYNPNPKSLLENINTYIDQCGKVFLIDNSTNDFKHTSLPENIDITKFSKNLGIAYAQNVGVRKAKHYGFKYVIEIDQDSKLPEKYVERLLREFLDLNNQYGKILGVGPLAISEKQGIDYYGYSSRTQCFIVDHTLSSGFLYCINDALECGEKNEGLFIDMVDWEWCMRAKNYGLNTFISPNVSLFHSLGEGHLRLFKLNIGVPKEFRHYYQFRNTILLFKMSHIPLKWKIKNFIKIIVKVFFYPFLLNNGISRLKFMLLGIRDGLLGKQGPIESYRQ